MKKFKLKVGLDVDDILFSCNEYAVELTNMAVNFDPPLTLEEIQQWEPSGKRIDLRLEYFKDPVFFETQPVLPGAVAFVQALSEIAEVFFLTAVEPEFMGIRAKKLQTYFPFIPKENIIMSSRKDLVEMDIILDDGAHNVTASKSSYPVLMRKPWNRHMTGCLAVNNYEEFLTFVRCVIASFHEEKKIKGNKIFALVGPSASGKTALLSYAVKNGLVLRQISDTTRAPRTGEVHGTDYFFLSQKEFLEKKEAGAYFETTRYAGEHYGSTREGMESLLKKNHVSMATDICGAIALKNAFPDKTVLIFIKRGKEPLIESILDRDCSNQEKTKRILSLSDEYKNEVLCDETIQNTGTLREAEEQFFEIIKKY